MKKIVFLIDNLKGGGAEKAIKIIVEELASRNLKPIIILLEKKMDYNLSENIELYILSNRISKYNFLWIYLKFLMLLKKLSPDVLYATNTKSQILSLCSKLFINNIKTIINIQVDLTKQYEERKYIFSFYKRLLKFADQYSFISHGIYINLKDMIPKKTNIFIANPIDFDEINNLKLENIEEEYKNIFSKKVFITIGRLTQQKGQEKLIEAFSLLEEDFHLIILGTGEKEQELKSLAKKYNIQEQVFFLGFQKNPFKFLQKADIFILSSLWEGFGNVIIEAMSCNIPVISTDCPSGPREILAPNSDINFRIAQNIEFAQFGILVPVADSRSLSFAMKKMHSDIMLQKKYKDKGIQRINDYDKKVIVNKFIKEVLED